MPKGWSVRKDNRRDELKMQNYIIGSYLDCGGFAKKWASDLQAGQPDLIAALPGLGGHLVEVKHRPEWDTRHAPSANPMEPLQIEMARKFINGGMAVFGLVIVGSSNVIGSYAVPFHPLDVTISWDEGRAYAYRPGKGYNVSQMWVDFQKTLLR